jgi:alanyl-tRNA synthetase
MTERLYYHDSCLYDFEATILDVLPATPNSRPAVLLDRTAFYPTSGGQVFDTGVLSMREDNEAEPKGKRIIEVADSDDDRVLHFVDDVTGLAPGTKVRGFIDQDRRRDHMQQHSGQHVLSAAFAKLFNFATVSFHMGEDYCSIDLATTSLTDVQLQQAERLGNEVVLEARPVDIRFVTQAEAAGLGLRKLPPAQRGELRLIDIRDFDLSACGGTHVHNTGQIGSILLRKFEKVRQGMRVEFVCGQRAVKTARRDYTALSESARLFSAQLWDVPQQIRKLQDDAKASRRLREALVEELAQHYARQLLAETPAEQGRKFITRVFPDRDLPFIKILAQQLTRATTGVIALLATTPDPAALVFAQSAGLPFDMGALMKESLFKLGGRGGGSHDMAQGGPQNKEGIAPYLHELTTRLRSS